MVKNQAIIKRDSFENWNKAKNYIPAFGTIIVIDMPDNSVQLKMGDGKTLVGDLLNILNTSQATVENSILNLGGNL